MHTKIVRKAQHCTTEALRGEWSNLISENMWFFFHVLKSFQEKHFFIFFCICKKSKLSWQKTWKFCLPGNFFLFTLVSQKKKKIPLNAFSPHLVTHMEKNCMFSQIKKIMSKLILAKILINISHQFTSQWRKRLRSDLENGLPRKKTFLHLPLRASVPSHIRLLKPITVRKSVFSGAWVVFSSQQQHQGSQNTGLCKNTTNPLPYYFLP